MPKSTEFDMGVKTSKPTATTFEQSREDAYPDEDWSPIEGYEGLYAISNLGKVKRLTSGTNTHAGKILTPIINKKTGYPYVKLCKNGKTRKAKLHLMVASAFLPPSPDPDFIVEHKSGIKTDARAENLEYISRSENTKRAIRMGLQKLCYASDNGNSKLSNEQIAQLKQDNETGNYTQKLLAEKYGISRTYTNYVLNGKYRYRKS
jgi:hypothetical protein